MRVSFREGRVLFLPFLRRIAVASPSSPSEVKDAEPEPTSIPTTLWPTSKASAGVHSRQEYTSSVHARRNGCRSSQTLAVSSPHKRQNAILGCCTHPVASTSRGCSPPPPPAAEKKTNAESWGKGYRSGSLPSRTYLYLLTVDLASHVQRRDGWRSPRRTGRTAALSNTIHQLSCIIHEP